MNIDITKETTGAWVIHHGRKIALDASGPADFPALDEAAKAATFLTRLGQSNEVTIRRQEVEAIAKDLRLNPRYELTGILNVLQNKRLIDQSEGHISVLGVTTRGALGHAADLYFDAGPSKYEMASVTLAELASNAPVRRSDIGERIGDEHKLAKHDLVDFLDRSEEIGFVDREGEGEDRLLFNGNLFRRESAAKTQHVLSSLTDAERHSVKELASRLSKTGCLPLIDAEHLLSKPVLTNW